MTDIAIRIIALAVVQITAMSMEVNCCVYSIHEKLLDNRHGIQFHYKTVGE